MVKVAMDMTIDPDYKNRFFRTKFLTRILDGFRYLEGNHFEKKIEKTKIDQPPVFIIGFWRSGTTVLHNMMCQNPDFGFVNTFQGVFPNDCFMNQWWIRGFAKLLLPDTRPGDNMPFDFSFPQEEEIALGNMQHVSF